MIEHLPQALLSLSAALTISKSLINIRDTTKFQDALIQFNTAIIDAQSKIIASQGVQSTLMAKIDELEKECMRLKNWEAKREKYSREEIASGVFAYIENSFVGNFENAHKYCCNCFDSFHESTLNQASMLARSQKILSCHNKCPDMIFSEYKTKPA